MFEKVLGLYTRNYLRFHEGLKKPSKDLRMFDPTLEHVILIDDNESRVVQKNLNYRIPKFNADLYLNEPSVLTRLFNKEMLLYVAKLIAKSTETAAFTFEDTMGNLSKEENGELKRYLSYLKENHPELAGTTLEQVQEVFKAHFYVDVKRTLTDLFPLFKNGVLMTPIK